MYYARQNWSEEDKAVFTNVGTEYPSFAKVCKCFRLAVKIGCTSKLGPGKGEDDYQYDSEDEEFLGVVPQEEIIGIDPGNLQTHESKAKPYSLLKPCAHRGSKFVWGNSHLTSEGEFSRGTNYVAFYTKTMFRQERDLHRTNRDLGLWTGCGEWFFVDGDFMKEQVNKQVTTLNASLKFGTWVRKRAEAEPDIKKLPLKNWEEWGLI